MADAAAAAHQQALANALVPPGAPLGGAPVPNINQLLAMIANMQQQQQQLQQHLHALPPPPPAQGPVCIKTTLPSKYNRTPSKAQNFLNKCNNYFVLNPMTTAQSVCFTLQFLEGEATHWKQTSLNAFQLPVPPAWSNDWQLFKAHFN